MNKNVNTPLPLIFLSLGGLFVILGLLLTYILDKGYFVLFLNYHHTSYFDLFFRYYTHTGSGWIFLVLAIATLFFSYRWTITIVLVAVGQGVTSFLMKGILFSKWQRPLAYFSDLDLSIVAGVDPLYFRSFPSGHSMTAFGVATFLSILTSRKWLQGLFFIYAFLVALSRMYLTLHFLIDTVVGAMLGIFLTLIIVRVVNNSPYFSRHKWSKKLTHF